MTVALFSCADVGTEPDVERAFRIVEGWVSAESISRRALLSANSVTTPSGLLAHIFSSFGAAEWPPREGSGEFSPEEESELMRMGQLLPKDIAIVRDSPDPKFDRQIVVTADDTGNMLVASYYSDAAADPMETRKFRLGEAP